MQKHNEGYSFSDETEHFGPGEIFERKGVDFEAYKNRRQIVQINSSSVFMMDIDSFCITNM